MTDGRERGEAAQITKDRDDVTPLAVQHSLIRVLDQF